jgi:hypothetical protein
MANAQPSEADLWQANIDALRLAVQLRKPDAIARLKLQVDRLDREISALLCRRELIKRVKSGEVLSNSFQAALNEFEHWKAGNSLTQQITTRIEMLTDRMDSLRAIGDLVRASPLDHDTGANPEQAAKANVLRDEDGIVREIKNQEPGTDDLSSELKRAASDIRSGWLVVVKRSTAAVSGKQPGGDLDSGKPAILAEQYYHWVSELHRKRMATYVVDDVVCEGLSRAECAQRRRCYVEKVYAELVAGLTLYAETYPPLSEGEG